MPRSSRLRKAVRTGGLMGVCALAGGALFGVSADSKTAPPAAQAPASAANGAALVRQGRQIFRYDDFGDDAFWSGALGSTRPSRAPPTAASARA